MGFIPHTESEICFFFFKIDLLKKRNKKDLQTSQTHVSTNDDLKNPTCIFLPAVEQR